MRCTLASQAAADRDDVCMPCSPTVRRDALIQNDARRSRRDAFLIRPKSRTLPLRRIRSRESPPADQRRSVLVGGASRLPLRKSRWPAATPVCATTSSVARERPLAFEVSEITFEMTADFVASATMRDRGFEQGGESPRAFGPN